MWILHFFGAKWLSDHHHSTQGAQNHHLKPCLMSNAPSLWTTICVNLSVSPCHPLQAAPHRPLHLHRPLLRRRHSRGRLQRCHSHCLSQKQGKFMSSGPSAGLHKVLFGSGSGQKNRRSAIFKDYNSLQIFINVPWTFNWIDVQCYIRMY